MNKRESAIVRAKVAGYHEDRRAFTRLVIESRVNRKAMLDAWRLGIAARANGIKCDCYECKNGGAS
jgi:hypothetical protein